MTTSYERLKECPQTNINRSDLTYKERSELRTISVTGTRGHAKSNTPGTYTDIYYLEGDEKEAVQLFVKENRELLEKIDFSTNRNAIQTSAPRKIYDLILHELGVREFKKYETVVVEDRPDGTTWIIDRNMYENHPNRRYSQGTFSAKVPPRASLSTLYDDSPDVITMDYLQQTDIEGDVRQVLDYYRVADEFSCHPTTSADSTLAVQKLSPDGTDILVTERAFARTYRNYDKPWQTVREYRHVQESNAKDPTKGIAEIANELGIKYSRVYAWLNEGKTPFAVQGIETAKKHGWLEIDETASVFDGLNILVAWIFSGGSISQEVFVPSLSIDSERYLSVLDSAFESVGVEYQILDRERAKRGIEVRPAESASALGRVLHVLGAPIGPKAQQKNISLPGYLNNVSENYRRDFAQVYLLNRGSLSDKSVYSAWLELSESRSVSYLHALRAFFEDVTREQVTINIQNQKVYVSNEAVRTLAGGDNPIEAFIHQLTNQIQQ